jgi:hypothetical protein
MVKPQEVLESARQEAMLTVDELWIRYLGLGGSSTVEELKTYLDGTVDPVPHEHDLLAQALNERFKEMDLDWPIAYAKG